jgi:hypothetical protein
MVKDQEDSGFRVTDRRIFTGEGEVRKDAEPPRESQSESSKAPAPMEEVLPGDEACIDFTSYVLSYYTQGLVLLGEVPNPLTNSKEQDLQGARHTIDILSMLEEKTKGNLSTEESQLLGSVLYELRMKFMAKTNRIKL